MDIGELLRKSVPFWLVLVMQFGAIGGMSKRPWVQWTMVFLICVLSGWAIFRG